MVWQWDNPDRMSFRMALMCAVGNTCWYCCWVAMTVDRSVGQYGKERERDVMESWEETKVDSMGVMFGWVVPTARSAATS